MLVAILYCALAQELGCGSAGRFTDLVGANVNLSFTAPYQGMYTISTCGSNYDTEVRITGSNVDISQDDVGICPINPKSEVFNEAFLRNETYNFEITSYVSGSGTRVLTITIDCPDSDESLTYPPTMVGQVEPIRCGDTTSHDLGGSTRWYPYVLDLSNRSGNTRVYISTCDSTTRNPEL